MVPRIVLKIVFAVLTGGATYVLTSLTDRLPAASLFVSILLGGVILLAQFLVDLERRQHQVERLLAESAAAQAATAGQVRAAVREEIAKINKATALYTRLDEAQASFGSVARLVELAAGLDHGPVGPVALVHKVAQAEVDAAVGFLDQLSHGGEITYDGEDRDWLLALSQHVQHTIDATSRGSVGTDGLSFTDEGFWESELSNRYLERQRDAIRRGVVVRRIFILETADLLGNDDFRKLCEHQLSIGVRVRVMDVSALAPYRRMNQPDLVLFDEEVAYELTSAPRLGGDSAPYFIRTGLVVSPAAVQERVRLFADYWSLSHDFA